MQGRSAGLYNLERMDTVSAEREYHRITEERLSRFGRILQQQEYSRGTVENYIRSVRAFRAWHHGGFDKCQVLAWKAQLVSCCAPATVNAMLAGINCFFRFQGWEDCVVKPLRLQRRSFSVPERELNKNEYFRLVKAARAAGKERLTLVMETICATGLRVSEVPYITLEAAVDGKAEIALKGKIRTILLPGKLCRKLLRYARARNITSGRLFLTRSGRPLSRVQIWSEMKRLCRTAGVPESKVFPHNLRHLFAKTFYLLYRDIVKLADILGHSSINTTRLYLLTDGSEHIRKLEHMHLLC